MDAFDNTGFALLREPEPAVQQGHTLVVLGVSRGGTSAMAGILHALGIFMGGSGKPPMFEDLYLNKAVRERRDADIQQRISLYNQQHETWGYKGTVLNHDLAHYHGLFRRPRYLVVFRDVLAIAKRASISAGHPVPAIMTRQLNEYERICQFLQQVSPPALMLSYEKLCQNPAPAIEAIAEFAGIKAEPARLQAAEQLLRGARDHYLEVSQRPT